MKTLSIKNISARHDFMLSLTEVPLLCPPPHPYKDVEAARKERANGAKSRKPKNKNGGETTADAAAAGSAGTLASDQHKGDAKQMKSKTRATSHLLVTGGVRAQNGRVALGCARPFQHTSA